MNKIDGPGSEKFKDFRKEEPPYIDSLVDDMKEKILSYLNETDFQSANLLNHEWHALAVQVVHVESQKIRGFVNFLITNLGDDFVIQRDSISDVVKSNPLLDSVNLIYVKASINTLVEKIINILKEVEDSELKRLDDLSKEKKPKTLEHLFTFVELYKEIESWDSVPIWEKAERLKPIVEDLIELGNLKKALEVIKVMPQTDDRKKFILNLFDKLSKKGILSIELVKMLNIHDYLQWSEGAKQISKLAEQLCQFSINFAKKGDTDKALEIATLIPELNYRRTVDAIFGVFEHGPKCVLDLDFPEHSEKVKALRFIAQMLADKGEFDKARNVAEKIENASKTKKAVDEYIKTKENQ